MKWTRASVAEYISDKGYEPIQIDGIPEGFVFVTPDITIGGVTHSGELCAFIPKSEEIIRSDSWSELLQNYLNKTK